VKPIAVIPARANSQRLPQKNLRRLGGKPLVQWAIEAAQASELFRDIYVSSDDAAIKKIAKAMGVDVLHRHTETARRDATLAHVVLEVRAQTGKNREPIFLMPPTNPFRNPETMRKAWTTYTTHDDIAKVVSVRAFHDPPQWALVRNGKEGRVEPMFPDAFGLSRQPARATPWPSWRRGRSAWTSTRFLTLSGRSSC
jgi:CMP-N-acetylneuraminic acid synthetase